METYQGLMNRQAKEFQELPIFFAFSKKQFEDGMKSIELTVDDVKQITSITGGGYIKKNESYLLFEMMNRHEKELVSAMDTGYDFCFQMFSYQLSNHEYCITCDVKDTIDVLGLSKADIQTNPVLAKSLIDAIAAQFETES